MGGARGKEKYFYFSPQSLTPSTKNKEKYNWLLPRSHLVANEARLGHETISNYITNQRWSWYMFTCSLHTFVAPGDDKNI